MGESCEHTQNRMTLVCLCCALYTRIWSESIRSFVRSVGRFVHFVLSLMVRERDQCRGKTKTNVRAVDDSRKPTWVRLVTAPPSVRVPTKMGSGGGLGACLAWPLGLFGSLGGFLLAVFTLNSALAGTDTCRIYKSSHGCVTNADMAGLQL
jgi:hypothetical protein